MPQLGISLDKLCAKIAHGNDFVVATHRLPDGDGIGSQMALHLGLLAMGKRSTAVGLQEVPPKFGDFGFGKQLLIHRAGASLGPFQVAFIVDTNESAMLGDLGPALRASAKEWVFIDHHVPRQSPEGAEYFFDEEVAASGELVYRILKMLKVKMSLPICEALYVAILTDTGGFRYRRTSGETHRIAAELIDGGVQPEAISRRLFCRDSFSKLRLLGNVLDRLEQYDEGRVAVLTIPLSVRQAYGATVEDTESFVNQLGLLENVEFGVLLREDEREKVKVSLRSYGKAEVVGIAESLGGGGHRFAAGATVEGEFGEVKERVLEKVRGLTGRH